MMEENVDIDKVGKNDFQKLLLCERQLLKQQKWLENAINNIKSQRIALEVESLNIQSMMNEEIRKQEQLNKMEETYTVDVNIVVNQPTNQDITTLTGEMDSTQSGMNTKTLDLSIDNMIDEIIQTNAYSESESEKED